MGISLITTVKNEEHSIAAFLSSICRQTRLPDEVVIVDGGSTDQTVALIREAKVPNVHLVEYPSNIAAGRNVAIRLAAHDFIAVTDAGCHLHPDWLEKITSPLSDADVVVGGYRPIVKSLFDACQGSVVGLFGSERTLKRFSPSSRSLAFRKSMWEGIGGYPEWLDYSEDAYFHKQLLAKFRVLFAPDAVVEWEQRKTLASVFRQFFRYMEGEALGGLHPGRNLLRFVVYLSALLWLPLTVTRPLLLLPLLVCGIAYSIGSYRKFVRLNRYPLLGFALLVIPGLLLFSDIAKMTGYLSGIVKLLRRPACGMPVKASLKSRGETL
jgi:glycosyltransferase involved in cell wall biosynthesis